jgi:NADPH:quinone reductase-like Zn-dependent oxidoreductase
MATKRPGTARRAKAKRGATARRPAARARAGGAKLGKLGRSRKPASTGAGRREERLQRVATMKAAAIDRFGPPSVLTMRTLPVPECGPDEVLIAMQAVGVGVWDTKFRDGEWAEGKQRFPLVLGTDGAGFVVAKGKRVRRFDVGDLVYAYKFGNPKGGFYAQFVAVDAKNVSHIPPQLSLVEAGAAAATGLTALQGIDVALAVKKGETVLIFGASGALGTLAVQFAKRRGARVIGAASGRDGAALVQQLGADAVFDGHRDDAAKRLRSLAPDGIDAALVLAGGEMLERCLDVVRARGRIAYPNGVEPEPRKRPKVRVIAYDGAVGPRELARLERAAAEARLRVPVAERFPLAKAAQAHARLERGHVLGRIVLDLAAAG